MAYNMIHTTPTTGAVAMFQALTLWLAAGCTVTKSGDGLALFSNVGNVITTGASGAGGLANARSWFVIAWGGGEEWCFQRPSANTAWRIKVSRANGFSGGAPSSTQVPSATDEQVILGSGTDAAPVGNVLFQTDGTYYFSAGIDTTTPRRHWWEAYAIAGSVLQSILFRDIVVPTEATDADVYIRGVHGSGSITAATITGAVSGSPTSTPYFMGYVPSLTPTVVAHMPMSLPTVSTTPSFPGASGTLSINGKDPLAVPRYQRSTTQGAPVVLKGDSTLFAFCGPNRANGDRMTVASANDRVVFGNLTTPWDNTVVTL